jgi:hypothetical protein
MCLVARGSCEWGVGQRCETSIGCSISSHAGVDGMYLCRPPPISSIKAYARSVLFLFPHTTPSAQWTEILKGFGV